MCNCLSSRSQRLQTESGAPSNLNESVPAEQEQGNEEIPDQPRDVHTPSGSAAHADENEGIAITSIQATGVALGLGRIPAGFYTVVQHGGLEWRTENKCSSVNNDVVEWGDPIPLPSDPTAIVRHGIYATFELQPVLGNGELLRELTITVEQLLNHSAGAIPFTFSPDDRDVVSPCSSILVTVRRWKRESSDPSALKVLNPHRPAIEYGSELENATDAGHSALSRYRKHGEKQDLERSIEQFEHALNICPLDHPCRAAAQSNLGMAKLILYNADDTLDSLDIPLTLYRNALSARPVGHPDRASTLIKLADVHFARFMKRGDEVDAVEADALLREAMDLSSADSHESRAAVSVLQAHAGRKTGQTGSQSSVQRISTSGSTNKDPLALSVQLLSRFERRGDLNDLQRAISLLETFTTSTSVRDSQYLVGLSNFGLALLHRFRRLGELSDLEQAISKSGEAVDLTPDGHSDKPARFNNLGNTFFTRFERFGELNDLEQAISRQAAAVDLVPDGHLEKPRWLNNLGTSFLTRFEHLGDLSDLEHAISWSRDAVSLILDDHSDKPACLSNLGNAFLSRFEYVGELSDLEEAISRQRNAVDLTPDGHPAKPGRLNNLYSSFVTRFQHLGELGDLEQAISGSEDAIAHISDDHPHKLPLLNTLGNSLLTRFEHLGELSDLHKAILRFKDSVDLTPDGHPEKLLRLNNLGHSFLTRFECLGDLSDLEQAMLMFGDASDLIPDGHPHKAPLLNNLALSSLTRFGRQGELSDLNQAIAKLTDATDLTPDGHPDKPDRLNNLGNCFFARFERFGEVNDLEQAISRRKDSLDLGPTNHPHKAEWLSNLGTSFLRRFQRLGELNDLEEAISMQRAAVDLTPDGHTLKPTSLFSLGHTFLARLEHLGELSDLEQAISLFRNVVDLVSDNHPDKFAYLTGLGGSLLTRFRWLSELSDLDEAISRQEAAVDLVPDGHPDAPVCLNNLGSSFFTRFQHLRELGDLERAMSRFGDSVDLTPDGHPNKPLYLNNLGGSFIARFEQLGELSDLEEAISKQKDAIDLTPDGHHEKPGRLINLSRSFRIRFARLGDLTDLEQAISTCGHSVDLTPDGHPGKPRRLYDLGLSFEARFKHYQQPSDFRQAISLYSRAAFATTGRAATRFHASLQWISCARASGHPSLLHAYSVSIGLLPQVAWIGLSLSHRYRELMQGADVAREAAAAALDLGLHETAVEWLEQGRSIVWGELFQLRSSYEELLAAHPDHAGRLGQLSAALEQASATREKSLASLSEPMTQGAEHHATKSLEQEASRHRTLAIERDKLLKEIRELPGFERFLIHKELFQLRTSAHSGPVVILNAAKTRCDALIVLADVENVIHVPLPNFTLARSEGLQHGLQNLLGQARDIPYEEREGSRDQRRHISWESVLSILWNGVVKPVLDALAFSTPGDLSRIFWCPTGPFTFLPIHAAGLYGTQSSEPGHKASDFVVSSYAPTLGILTPSSNPAATSNGDLRFLAVRQPPSDGQSRLPGVEIELGHIKTIILNSPLARTTLMETSTGTVEEVLGMMKGADWVHFACHGIQDAANPAESGLCLADERRLKIPDIIALSRPRGGLAFLSACETATGDEDLSDEAIHIAAGMLFAGYGGVVGTMWSISDKLAPSVARDVYKQLFGDGTRPDYRKAAKALQDAVGRLRDSGASLAEWLPFIHVGL